MLIAQKVRTLLITLLLCAPGCKKPAKPLPILPKLSTITASNKPFIRKTHHHLMVFIHGTLLPFPSLECFGSALHTFLAKGRTLKKSWYQLYIDKLKQNSIFKYQPNGPDGLHLIDGTSSATAQIAAAVLECFYQQAEPTVKLSCYTFGWNGRLSQKKRLYAAFDLYRQLTDELTHFAPEKTTITLIGHSHGGNVILNLAQAEETYKKHLSIDKILLLGTPVQSETQPLLASPIFKSIYHFYSHGDSIQKLDFISTKDDYSQRRFPVTPQDTYADKLTQIELKLGRYEPGHGELWLLWGKDNNYYRENLPIFPLPTYIFLPEIIQQLEKFYSHPNHLTINIDQNNSNYTFAIFDKTSKAEHNNKELAITKLPKKYFAPYVQTILQNENYRLEKTGI